ncbi:gamma-butyrobetaine hydroxylase-like domain-containing protein, partial [Neisseria sp. P0021.S004]
MTQADKIPQEIRLQKERRVLTLVYVDGAKSLPAEYLRVYSPSAEVRGHGPGQDVLQTGKAEVS